MSMLVSAGSKRKSSVERYDAWQCIGCGKIEAPQPFRDLASESGDARAIEHLHGDRSGQVLRLDVVEFQVIERRLLGRVGIGPQIPVAHTERMLIRVQHGPLESFGRALAKTWDISVFSLKMLGRMLLGQVSWKHLSGPVTIADFAGQSAQMGWISYLTFLALISISLGVLNLLPIPLLDGGHLMFYAIEVVKGRPVSERAMELGQRVGLALLLVVMAFAFYNDLNRLFTG